MLDSFEDLLNRPIIQDELEKKHINLLELYKQDLKTVASFFMEGKNLIDKNDEHAPISSNMPPVSGAINWTTGLLERIKEPMDRLSSLSQSMQDREEYKDVQKLYASLRKNLKEYNEQKVKQWEKVVEEHTEDQLNKFLLYREPTPIAEEGFVRVNFDKILVAMLREVKYLLLLDITVPERAQLLYKEVDTYRMQVGRLEIVTTTYNEMLAKLLPVEKPLLQDRIEKMDEALADGINTLTWNSKGIEKFIRNAEAVVSSVDEVVSKMKKNVDEILKIMEKDWKEPLFVRKPKPLSPDEFMADHDAKIGPRMEDILKQGKEIVKFIKDTNDTVNKGKKKSDTWNEYINYVNSLIIDGITNSIVKSMQDLAQQINLNNYKNTAGNPPLFDIKVDLQDRELIFDPPIVSNKINGIQDILSKIMADFISVAVQVPRIDSQSGGGDYLVEIKDQFVIFGATQIITQNFNDILNATNEFMH